MDSLILSEFDSINNLLDKTYVDYFLVKQKLLKSFKLLMSLFSDWLFPALFSFLRQPMVLVLPDASLFVKKSDFLVT